MCWLEPVRSRYNRDIMVFSDRESSGRGKSWDANLGPSGVGCLSLESEPQIHSSSLFLGQNKWSSGLYFGFGSWDSGRWTKCGGAASSRRRGVWEEGRRDHIAAFRDTWGGEVIPFTPHSGKEGPKRLKFTRRDTSLKNQHLSSWKEFIILLIALRAEWVKS